MVLPLRDALGVVEPLELYRNLTFDTEPHSAFKVFMLEGYCACEIKPVTASKSSRTPVFIMPQNASRTGAVPNFKLPSINFCYFCDLISIRRGNLFGSPSPCLHGVQTIASPFRAPSHLVVHGAFASALSSVCLCSEEFQVHQSGFKDNIHFIV